MLPCEKVNSLCVPSVFGYELRRSRHQAFFTREAITTISETTIKSVSEFASGQILSEAIQAN
jgi:lactate dehydrogenase-like 2-hydroxyacid dehydrogenase